MVEDAEPLKVLIVGAGNACPAHLRAIKELAERGHPIKIVGLCDLEPSKALKLRQNEEFQSVLAGAEIYDDYETALHEADANMVVVVTPPDSHEEVTIKALEAGKHVVCEKPISTSALSGERMIQAAKDSSREFNVVQNRAYTAAMQMMRFLIQQGVFGDIKKITTEGLEGVELLRRMPSISTDERGVMGTQAIHQAYMLSFLTGQDLDWETMKVLIGKKSDSPMVAPDGTAFITGKFTGGAEFETRATFEREESDPQHNIIVELEKGFLRSRRSGTQENRTEILEYSPDGKEWREIGLANPSVRGHEFAEMHLDQAKVVWSCGEHVPQRTAETAVQSMKILDYWYDIAESVNDPLFVESPNGDLMWMDTVQVESPRVHPDLVKTAALRQVAQTPRRRL